MPILEYDAPIDPDRTHYADLVIRAAMMWPNDAARRREFIASGLAVYLLPLKEKLDQLVATGHIPANFETERQAASLLKDIWRRISDLGGLEVIARAPGFDALEAEMNDRLGDWFAAGWILKLILQMATHHTDLRGGASINKAIHVLEHFHIYWVPRNSRDIRKAWSDYRPVAHFCAAFVDIYFPFKDLRLVAWDFPRFLSRAAAYLEFGLSYILPRSRGESLLDPALTWVLPEPPPWPSSPLNPQPLLERQLEVARAYRAPIPGA